MKNNLSPLIIYTTNPHKQDVISGLWNMVSWEANLQDKKQNGDDKRTSVTIQSWNSGKKKKTLSFLEVSGKLLLQGETET